ncbi:hypothetical protein ACO2KH_14350 [Leptospira terpstrae]|uniref:hypothetical protein n=1 Tax=Leptospira terpstrae TaxID=293075 RepID=UPI003D03A9F3
MERIPSRAVNPISILEISFFQGNHWILFYECNRSFLCCIGSFDSLCLDTL